MKVRFAQGFAQRTQRSGERKGEYKAILRKEAKGQKM